MAVKINYLTNIKIGFAGKTLFSYESYKLCSNINNTTEITQETNDNATSEIVNEFIETSNLINEVNTLLDHSKDVKVDDVSQSSVDVDDDFDDEDDYHSTDDSEEAIDDEVDGDGASDSNNDSLMYDQNVSDEVFMCIL